MQKMAVSGQGAKLNISHGAHKKVSNKCTCHPQMGIDPKAFSDTCARPGIIVMKLSSCVNRFSLLSYTMAVSPRRVEWMYIPLT
jgi:hypothetical protein